MSVNFSKFSIGGFIGQKLKKNCHSIWIQAKWWHKIWTEYEIHKNLGLSWLALLLHGNVLYNLKSFFETPIQIRIKQKLSIVIQLVVNSMNKASVSTGMD